MLQMVAVHHPAEDMERGQGVKGAVSVAVSQTLLRTFVACDKTGVGGESPDTLAKRGARHWRSQRRAVVVHADPGESAG